MVATPSLLMARLPLKTPSFCIHIRSDVCVGERVGYSMTLARAATRNSSVARVAMASKHAYWGHILGVPHGVAKVGENAF